MTTVSPHEDTWLRRVSDFHSGDVEAAEAAAVDEHLADCAECREALAIYRRFYALAGSPLRLGEPSSDLEQRLSTPRDAGYRYPQSRANLRTPRNRQLLSVASVLAASLVIAGFLAVLGPRIPGLGVKTTATPLPSVTTGNHRGGWVEQYQVDNSAGTLVVAPGDSRVIYRLLASLSFQRSDDGGKTWKTFSIPGQNLAGVSSYPNLVLQVSPLNADLIFASSSTSTPNYAPIFQYVSTNGGSTWRVPDLPVSGTLGEIISSFGAEISPPLSAQGNRLYAAVAVANASPAANGFRLVSSTDGVHWSLADAPLVARNLTVVEYAATPSGSTLFATTVPSAFGSPLFDRELWRSDDAGVRWTNLGPFPETQDPSATTYLFGAGFVGSKAIVYYVTAIFPQTSYPITNYTSGQAIAPENVYASLDNGKTWRAAPSTAPASAGMIAPYYMGTTNDGSLVVVFDTRLTTSPSPSGSIAFAAWRPGEKEWQGISPPLAALPSVAPGLVADPGPWLVSRRGAPATLWAVTREGDSLTFVVWSHQL